MNCTGFEQLVDYLDGRLAPDAAQSVAVHLGGSCAKCTADSAWYQQVKLVAASDDSVEPPAWILKRAIRIFDSQAARTSLPRRATRLIASLLFDSLERPVLAGARSSRLEGRQLLYQAEYYSIDLQVALLDQTRAELTGQILREGELMFQSVAGLQLDLMRDGDSILSTVTNERGEFRVETIELGSYDLRVDAQEASITIVGLPIE